MTVAALHEYLEQSARRYPKRCAAVEASSGRQITYGELDALSDQVRDHLRRIGVRPGNRVGICLPKSIASLAVLFGILKVGAAYVPVDSLAPPARNAFIFNDCGVRAIFVEASRAETLRCELARLAAEPCLLPLDWSDAPSPLATYLARVGAGGLAVEDESARPGPDNLAYVLYTSGSTGQPKGVMLTHRNGSSYVDWCSDILAPDENDRFSSHAPFHFDLSILDIFVPLKHGATVFLIGEELGKNPTRMASVIAERRLTVWYSTPSVLTLLVEHGSLDARDDHALRFILFAGEVFPVKHLRRLKAVVPRARYLNLYGPTETNVCTYYEIPQTIAEDHTAPFPIGRACSHVKARVIDANGRNVPRGQEGELAISGAPVMRGYWNMPERTSAAFHVDSSGRWYRTGDVVIEGDGGVYTFRGRRDRMVKRRGYRIELGEIETALYRHPEISEVAAIARSEESGVSIKVFYASRDGHALSLIELKRFCAHNLPAYMAPDWFSHQQLLPKTSTDKIDYQHLMRME
ncbi:MAG: D-alanine--poly(phosphoribitol) ligase [Mesorhizobium sp.]|uniref:amino acid adenylation domain-containing protein n=1 Tax=Mesorhizobium sp. TaxID=1871066 RepID=UPI000FE9EEFF|nr:amino acid adenylation domain-containing protein [Mesorhizobium sp.]RWK57654.1 MAG: D-alanine--poly(phosphoribitol) ligase [Mesorhizobium sp.]TIP47385.1 MAG: D-alanine--poly(phosphoribitol) ligase [Mesorhizobium sp.]TJX07577.1 MAG: D-alanine--poly(phosphoribitol) ligase [Mesorhizobium sp.]